MDAATKPTKISRIDLRYRHLAQDVAPDGGSVQEREETGKQEEDQAVQDERDSSSSRGRREQPAMGNAHRMFHRRQASASNVLTVVVDVVATVDSNSNVIALQTITPALPSVPPVQTILLPSVPAVPPFPPDLTVPAYPWPSGVPSQSVPGSQLVISTGSLTDVPPTPTLFSSSLGYNSTITSSLSQTASSSSSLNSTSSNPLTTSSASSSSQSSGSSSSTRASSQTSSLYSTSPPPSTSLAGGGGGGAPEPTAPSPAETNAAASGSDSGSGGTPTPTVVGSVVGSLAGVALILAVILLLLRRHKRNRRGALQLSENDPSDHQPIAASGQQMAMRSSVLPAGATAFLNRFSGASKSTAETSTTTGERGFQRISGRKLPSAFSEGMTSEQFARGGEATLSGSSFYRDDQGFYGGPGVAANKEFGKEIGDSPAGAMGTKERIMPSPARTPVVHHAGDAPPWGTSRNGGGSTLSPPHSPNPSVPPRGTLGRSHPSHDGSRGSRFTEDV